MAATADNDLSAQIEQYRNQGNAIRMAIPIYSQVVFFSVPKNFRPVLENAANGRYIQELVPTGETQKKWTQKITVLGFPNLSAMPNVTPALVTGRLAQGFQKDCPSSFTNENLGSIKLSGHDATAAMIGCGTALPQGAPYSEGMLSIVIKGAKDYYLIQWAERGEASTTPFAFSGSVWAQRLNALKPIIVCTPQQGESPPYESCISAQGQVRPQ